MTEPALTTHKRPFPHEVWDYYGYSWEGEMGGCDECMAGHFAYAKAHDLVIATRYGTAINDDGEKVEWISGDFVHVELLRRSNA